MTDPIRFTLDGGEVEAAPGETIWQAASRLGTEIPHLCWLPKPGYRADGNCRACMVEIEGERVLAASCIRKPAPDRSHVAMAVQLDACIQCNLCVRACREVQVNDVIGMAARGHNERIVFDFDDPMGGSTCVACGECVQACPTGALKSKTIFSLWPRPA